MTCVIGFVDEKNRKMYIGADSAGVSGNSISRRRDEKVFRTEEMLVGFTSSFRMGQLLRYGWNPPEQWLMEDTYEYMVTRFIDSVRERFKNGGFAKSENGEEVGGCFIVMNQGKIFTIESDYQVGEQIAPYAAVGCGAEIALGSLFSTNGMLAKMRIETALMAAEEYSSGVRGPFHTLELSY